MLCRQGILKIMDKRTKHNVSFLHALDGIIWAIKTQPNFRIHLVLSFVALFLCWFFQVTLQEFIIILFTIILGLSAEMINTSLEAMTDLITLEYRQHAKIAKDVSAGMMLLVALGAVVVGSVVFVPKILTLIIR